MSYNNTTTRAGADSSANYCSTRQPYQRQSKPQFSYNYRRDRPPGPPPDSVANSISLNFIIELYADGCGLKKSEIESLKANLKVRPDNFFVFDRGMVAGRFYYQEWVDMFETIVRLSEKQE